MTTGRARPHVGEAARWGCFPAGRRRPPACGRPPLGECPRPPAARPSPTDPEAGFAGGFEGLLFGFLLFVAGTLLVAYAWGVVDTKAATEAAARQAASTLVQAPSAAVGTAQAQQVAAQALAGYGRNPDRAAVAVSAGAFGRCQRVTVTVSYPAPAMELPFIGAVGAGPVVRAAHSELVDPFRSGLPGTATCP